MAIYYWQGTARTEANKYSTDPYDWNYPPNWRKQNSSSIPLSQIPVSDVAPGAGDQVYIGYAFTAKSPLLFGGCSGMAPIGGSAGATGSYALWLNAGRTAQAGTTFSADLKSIVIAANEVTGGSIQNDPFYKFPWVGGGIGRGDRNDINNWLYERGCTAALGHGVSSRLLDGLNVRVRDAIIVNTTGRIDMAYPVGYNPAIYGASGPQNYSIVDINLVPSKSTRKSNGSPSNALKLEISNHWNTPISGGPAPMINPANIRGGGDVTIRRYRNYYDQQYTVGGVPLISDVGIYNNSYIEWSTNGEPQPLGLTTAPSRALRVSFYDAMIDTVNATGLPNLWFDPGCTLSRLAVLENFMPLSESGTTAVGEVESITVQGSFNSSQVLTALGFSADAQSTQEGIEIYDAYGTEGLTSTLWTPQLRLGAPIDSFPDDPSRKITIDNIVVKPIRVDNLLVSDNPNREFINRPWQIEFIGPASLTSVDAYNCRIMANDNPGGVSGVAINTLNLSRGAILDLEAEPQFNNWTFGTYIQGVTGSPNGFMGGIVYGDKSAKIIGSPGVRLYNTKTVGANYDIRSATNPPTAKG